MPSILLALRVPFSSLDTHIFGEEEEERGAEIFHKFYTTLAHHKLGT